MDVNNLHMIGDGSRGKGIEEGLLEKLAGGPDPVNIWAIILLEQTDSTEDMWSTNYHSPIVSFHAIAPYITSLYNLDIDTPHGKKEIAMAMVTNSKINLLNYLKPTKTAWKVEVKVINSWKQHSNYPKGDTYEFILEDKMVCYIFFIYLCIKLSISND
ncbi:hypothetical protein YC2023_044873 [Brassica napus]